MKKVLSAAMAAVMVVSMAGCGSAGKTAETTTAAPAAATEKTEETTAADTKEAASSGEVTTIEFFQMKDEGTDYYTALIKEFEAQNPDIKIEYTNVPDAETVLMTRMASDQVPDVFTHFPLDASFREQVKAGYMMDLTGETMLENVADDILDISLIDGKSYSVPVSLNMLGVYYNKDLFDKAGVEYPKDGMTLTDYRELAANTNDYQHQEGEQKLLTDLLDLKRIFQGSKHLHHLCSSTKCLDLFLCGCTECICFYIELFGKFSVSKNFNAVLRVLYDTLLEQCLNSYGFTVLKYFKCTQIDCNDILRVSVCEASLRNTSV